MSVRDVEATFAGAVAISSAAQSLKSGAFDSLYSTWGSSFAPARGYTRHPSPQVGTLLRLSTVELSHMCMSFQPNRLVAAQRPLQAKQTPHPPSQPAGTDGFPREPCAAGSGPRRALAARLLGRHDAAVGPRLGSRRAFPQGGDMRQTKTLNCEVAYKCIDFTLRALFVLSYYSPPLTPVWSGPGEMVSGGAAHYAGRERGRHRRGLPLLRRQRALRKHLPGRLPVWESTYQRPSSGPCLFVRCDSWRL